MKDFLDTVDDICKMLDTLEKHPVKSQTHITMAGAGQLDNARVRHTAFWMENSKEEWISETE